MRFYDRLMDSLSVIAFSPNSPELRWTTDTARLVTPTILAALSSSNRVLFDGKQAELFSAFEEGPPARIQQELRLPFDLMYIEFTNTFVPFEQEEDFEDKLACFLVSPWKEVRAIDGEWHRLHQVSVFFDAWSKNPPEGHMPEHINQHGFGLELSTGKTFTQYLNIVYSKDHPRVADDFGSQTIIDYSDPIEGASITDWIECGAVQVGAAEDRYIGQYERYCQHHGRLLSWMLTYMVAKGIEIVPEPLSRPQRRLLARKGLPNPWHVVRVDPRISRRGAPSQEPIGSHSYRYDVMGHFRFGRHKRKDGTYSETVEWVRPHQRGLANDRYIPKVSKFEGGRVPSKQMEQVWGAEEE